MTTPGKQLLHLVIGGDLKRVDAVEFDDLTQIDFVGAFPNYKAAYDAWLGSDDQRPARAPPARRRRWRLDPPAP